MVELRGAGCAVVFAVEPGRPFQADGSIVKGEELEEADPVRKSPVGHNEQFGLNSIK